MAEQEKEMFNVIVGGRQESNKNYFLMERQNKQAVVVLIQTHSLSSVGPICT